MSWKYPAFLWLLPALGALGALYVSVIRRRHARGAVYYPLWFVAEAAAHARPLRRHLPAALFLLVLFATIVGAAGPVVPWWAPTGWPVVLIIDISRSMEEPDIPPSRIAAARAAALDFVAAVPSETRVALVTFGNHASIVVPLTPDRSRMQEGIRGITTQLRTQLGNGLMEGIRAVTGEGGPSPGPDAPPAGGIRAIAILLSDGRASDGIPPLEAAAEAKRRGVRVYTVGVGTAQDPSNFRSGYWGVLDEPTLRAIASETGGQYFHAGAAGRLREIYRDLAGTVGWERRPTEVAAVVAGIAMVLLAASVALRFWAYPVHQ